MLLVFNEDFDCIKDQIGQPFRSVACISTAPRYLFTESTPRETVSNGYRLSKASSLLDIISNARRKTAQIKRTFVTAFYLRDSVQMLDRYTVHICRSWELLRSEVTKLKRRLFSNLLEIILLSLHKKLTPKFIDLIFIKNLL